MYVMFLLNDAIRMTVTNEELTKLGVRVPHFSFNEHNFDSCCLCSVPHKLLTNRLHIRVINRLYKLVSHVSN